MLDGDNNVPYYVDKFVLDPASGGALVTAAHWALVTPGGDFILTGWISVLRTRLTLERGVGANTQQHRK